MLTNIFRILSLLFIPQIIQGCSGHTVASGSTHWDRKHPPLKLREQIEAPLRVAEASHLSAPNRWTRPCMEPAMGGFTGRNHIEPDYIYIWYQAVLPRESEKRPAQKSFDEIKSRQIAEAIVIGHTDTMGAEQYQYRFCQNAALNEVRQELIRREYPEKYITTTAMGRIRTCLLKLPMKLLKQEIGRVEIDVRWWQC